MKTQSRIALVLFGSNVALILLFGVAIYYFQNKYSYSDFYKRLQTRASIASKYYFDQDSLSAEAIRTVREQHLEKLSDEKEFIIEIRKDTSLEVYAKKLSLPVDFVIELGKQKVGSRKLGNTFYSGISHVTHGREYLIIVSADNYYASHHLNFLSNILWIGIVLVALVTIGFSFYFSKRIFQPISRIAREVREISTESMHMRLEEQEDNNEITEVVNTFNDLLNRLETAFEAQKNFISNASHELSTPITAISGEAEVMLTRERTPQEYQEALRNILFQSERLDKITKSLLFLAQTGYKGKKVIYQEIRIDEIIWDVKDVMDNLNPKNRIEMDLSLLPDDPAKLRVNGNRELLHLAFANLVSNACKYSRNKPVSISIATATREVIVVIKDDGIGIPPEEMSFIYDPFFRASNTSQFEGYGIGLPLTRNIIRLHNGKLRVNSIVDEGTTIQVSLPLISA